ncbi:uncharacterized protein LOC111258261 [Setaria italica]|uniref:uncharacterized protein LOC111258261 n=1 Tax=Setaria italica TaxID=4555 RepID=UPI000BE4D045|nr:uncharacterized protein LOC111258261 [Setaria italica]
MEEAPASWSDIPVKLSGLVLGRLPVHVDRVRFAAVCPPSGARPRSRGACPRRCRCSCSQVPPCAASQEAPFHFPGCTGYTNACGTGNWLVFSGEDDCFLRDPFSNETVTLPALTRARMWDVGDQSVDEAGHAWMEMDEEEERNASKIIFCSPHLIAAIFRFMSDRERSDCSLPARGHLLVVRTYGSTSCSVC